VDATKEILCSQGDERRRNPETLAQTPATKMTNQDVNDLLAVGLTSDVIVKIRVPRRDGFRHQRGSASLSASGKICFGVIE